MRLPVAARRQSGFKTIKDVRTLSQSWLFPRTVLILLTLFACFSVVNPAQAQSACKPYWAMLPHYGANVPAGGSVTWPIGHADFEIVVRDDNVGNLLATVVSSDPAVVAVHSPGGVAHRGETLQAGSVVLTATPDNAACPQIIVNVTVAPPTAVPTVHDTTTTVEANSASNPVNLALDGHAIQAVQIVDGSGPDYGTAVATGTGISYTPNPGFWGTDSFQYTASNSVGPSAPATATIVVTQPPPVISTITPAAGPELGGTTVTITGSGLTAADGVAFGGVAAASYTVTSDTEITAVTPGRAAGAADVVVTTNAGNAVAAGGFVFLSSNATLSGLTASAGSLTPGFQPETRSYELLVDATTDSVTFTPTAADDGAVITVDGQLTGSGNASHEIHLPVGVSTLSIVVTAADGVMQQTYSIAVIREEFTTTLTLTQSADTSYVGDAVTFTAELSGATDPNGDIIFTIGDAEHVIKPLGARATFETAELAEGTHTIGARYEGDTNGNAAATAPSLTHTVGVVDLPAAQDHTMMVAAGTSGTLDLVRGAHGGPFTDATIVAQPPQEAGEARIIREDERYLLRFSAAGDYAGTTQLTYTLTNADGTSEPATVIISVSSRPDPGLDAEVTGLVRAQTEAVTGFATAQITNFIRRLEQLHSEAESHNDNQNFNTAGLGFWSSHLVNAGNHETGTLDLNSTLGGVSAGVDYRFTPWLTAGAGAGYGRDVTRIGSNGTESRAAAISVVAYGSYRVLSSIFIDALFGYSSLNFDSLRYVTGTGELASGSRRGQQVFAALSASYDYRNGDLMVAPYGRLSGSRSVLAAFAETGAGMWNLTFAEQDISTLEGTLGLRLAYDVPLPQGVFTARGWFEYNHEFTAPARAELGYSDLGTTPYALELGSHSRDRIAVGTGFDARVGADWTLSFDYRTAFSMDGASQDHAFGVHLGKR